MRIFLPVGVSPLAIHSMSARKRLLPEPVGPDQADDLARDASQDRDPRHCPIYRDRPAPLARQAKGGILGQGLHGYAEIDKAAAEQLAFHADGPEGCRRTVP